MERQNLSAVQGTLEARSERYFLYRERDSKV